MSYRVRTVIVTLCMRLFVQLLCAFAFLKIMSDVGVLLGGTHSNRILIEERMQEVIAFETAIAQVDCILCSPLCTW